MILIRHNNLNKTWDINSLKWLCKVSDKGRLLNWTPFVVPHKRYRSLGYYVNRVVTYATLSVCHQVLSLKPSIDHSLHQAKGSWNFHEECMSAATIKDNK